MYAATASRIKRLFLKNSIADREVTPNNSSIHPCAASLEKPNAKVKVKYRETDNPKTARDNSNLPKGVLTRKAAPLSSLV